MTTVTPAMIEATRADTVDHIRKVRKNLEAVIERLIDRGQAHDASKLAEPELSGYAALQANLAEIAYPSPEYSAALEAARPVIDHHYAANDHHPDHYPGGIGDMSLLAILEMLADWKAAGERMKGGSIARSLRHNLETRWTVDPQLARAIWRTALELGWVDPAEVPEL